MSDSTVVVLAEVRLAGKSGRARAIREAAGVSQSEVARDLGVSQASLSRWESGERAPRGQVAVRYAELLERLAEVSGAP